MQTTQRQHNWILALSVDIHSCSHVTASNMKPMGLILEQQSMFVPIGTVSHHYPCPRNSCHSRVLVETCCIILEAKLRVTCRNLNFQVNYEVAPVVRPILSVDMLTHQGVLVVFGVHGVSSFIQLPDGHKITMIRENGTMVLNATLVDRRNMKCDLVALVVSIAVPVSSEAGDEAMRDSRYVSECEAAHKFQCWEELVK